MGVAATFGLSEGEPDTFQDQPTPMEIDRLGKGQSKGGKSKDGRGSIGKYEGKIRKGKGSKGKEGNGNQNTNYNL